MGIVYFENGFLVRHSRLFVKSGVLPSELIFALDLLGRCYLVYDDRFKGGVLTYIFAPLFSNVVRRISLSANTRLCAPSRDCDAGESRVEGSSIALSKSEVTIGFA